MADEGDVPDVVHLNNITTSKNSQSKSSYTEVDGAILEQLPTYRNPNPRANTNDSTPFGSKRHSQHGSMNLLNHEPNVAQYFVGPRDLDRHSKLPFFMRMHGSVLPKMIVPLLLIGAWATIITVVTKKWHNLGISSILLTVLGFVVGLALSFRSSTAYERYADGRKAWSSLSLTSRTLSRLIWIHIKERSEDPELQKQDVLAKLSGINLIRAFSLALMHKLRFEPYAHYDDIIGHIGHLDTYAKEAYDPDLINRPPKTPWKRVGEYLGIPFAESNPRKDMKRAKKPVGNLPLEILTYLSAYIEDQTRIGNASAPLQGQLLACISTLTDVLTQSERVLNTPLPEAYTIAFSQITLMYILTLPFQLVETLGWIAIPGTLAGAYIILGLATIGHEIENPFGHDVNDLPLDRYCQEISMELDIVTSFAPVESTSFMNRKDNLLLFPLSTSGHDAWSNRSLADIRDALKAKTIVSMHREYSTSEEIHIEDAENVRRRTGAAGAGLKKKAADVSVSAVGAETSGEGGGAHSDAV